jgi:hypothetical protein
VNLNADMVDGVDASAFALASNTYTKAEVDAAMATAGQRKRFYFDYTLCDGSEALTVCNDGFHMANLFELAEPAVLDYAYEEVGAMSYGDMGTGPPTGSFGWIRTSGGAATSGGVGVSNCNAWTSSEPSHKGTLAALPNTWADPAFSGSFALVWGTPWVAMEGGCSGDALGVWCIED